MCNRKFFSLTKFMVLLLFFAVVAYGCGIDKTDSKRLSARSLSSIDSLLTKGNPLFSKNIREFDELSGLYIFLDGNCSCSIEDVINWRDRSKCCDSLVNPLVTYIFFGDSCNVNTTAFALDMLGMDEPVYFFSEIELERNNVLLECYNHEAVFIDKNRASSILRKM
ncbi:hypothetical protein DSECCO2_580790 [anaerobic digester metagenome]